MATRKKTAKKSTPAEAKMQVVSKVDKQRYTLGVVYEPGVPDSHDDFATAETIEKAAWGFMRKLQADVTEAKRARELIEGIHKALDGEAVRIDVTDWADQLEKGRLGDMHMDWQDGFGEIVESYIAPADFEIDGENISKGSWLMGVIWSQEMFSKIESGERTGYSLGGRAFRVEVDNA